MVKETCETVSEFQNRRFVAERQRVLPVEKPTPFLAQLAREVAITIRSDYLFKNLIMIFKTIVSKMESTQEVTMGK
jgi:hypothetical protein